MDATTEPDTAQAIRLKRLGFQSWHRGFREMDLLLGQFADAELSLLSSDELNDYERLLEAPDWDLYAWFTGTKPVPDNWDGPAFRRILTHIQARPKP